MKVHWKINPQVEKLVEAIKPLFLVEEEIFNPHLCPEENDFGFGHQCSRIKIKYND